MQASEWKALLRLIPKEYQDNLVAMTAGGTEINIQSVLRVEEAFLVLRGRVAGSTDIGRIFLIPFEQLDYLAFQRALSEAEVQAMLDGQLLTSTVSAPPAAEMLRPSAVEETASPPEESVPRPLVPSPVSPAPPAPAAALPSESQPARLSNRSDVIQRLRLRTAARADTPTLKE